VGILRERTVWRRPRAPKLSDRPDELKGGDAGGVGHHGIRDRMMRMAPSVSQMVAHSPRVMMVALNAQSGLVGFRSRAGGR